MSPSVPPDAGTKILQQAELIADEAVPRSNNQVVAEIFPTLASLRGRGMPWDKIAVAVEAAGVRRLDGQPFTAKALSFSYGVVSRRQNGATAPRARREPPAATPAPSPAPESPDASPPPPVAPPARSLWVPPADDSPPAPKTDYMAMVKRDDRPPQPYTVLGETAKKEKKDV